MFNYVNDRLILTSAHERDITHANITLYMRRSKNIKNTHMLTFPSSSCQTSSASVTLNDVTQITVVTSTTSERLLCILYVFCTPPPQRIKRFLCQSLANSHTCIHTHALSDTNMPSIIHPETYNPTHWINITNLVGGKSPLLSYCHLGDVVANIYTHTHRKK